MREIGSVSDIVGVVTQVGELGELREPGAAEEVATLAPHRDHRDAVDLRLVFEGERGAGAVHVGVEPAGESAVRGDVDEREVAHGAAAPAAGAESSPPLVSVDDASRISTARICSA